MLTQTIKAAESTQVVKPKSFEKIIVDSTVQEKAIAHPTDSKLLEPARRHLVKLATEGGLALRQNYNREAPKPWSGKRAHEERRAVAAQLAARERRRCLPRAALRLWTGPKLRCRRQTG